MKQKLRLDSRDLLFFARKEGIECLGVFIILLSYMRKSDGRITSDNKKLARLLGVDIRVFRRVWLRLGVYFDIDGDSMTSREPFLITFQDEKDDCRIKTRKAVSSGELKKEPCFCGNKNVQAHHEDYNDHLNVTWLCIKHHHERHVEMRRTEV